MRAIFRSSAAAPAEAATAPAKAIAAVAAASLLNPNLMSVPLGMSWESACGPGLLSHRTAQPRSRCSGLTHLSLRSLEGARRRRFLPPRDTFVPRRLRAAHDATIK